MLWHKSTIVITANPIQHEWTKHIKVKYHVLREAEKEGDVKLTHCSSQEQHVDILTKALSYNQFEVLWAKLGVTQLKTKEC